MVSFNQLKQDSEINGTPKTKSFNELKALKTVEGVGIANGDIKDFEKAEKRGVLGNIKYFLGEGVVKPVARGIESIPAQAEAVLQVGFKNIQNIAEKQLADDEKTPINERSEEQARRIALNTKILNNMSGAINTSKRLQQNWIDATQTGIEAPKQEFLEASPIPWDKNFSYTRMFALGFESVPMLGLAATVTAATRSPTAGAVALGTMEAAGEFGKAVEKGKPVEQANKVFVLDTIALSALETVPLTSFLKGGSIPMRAFRTATQEGGEEALQELWKSCVAKIGYDETVSLTNGLVESFIGGFISGGIIGGFGPSEDMTKRVEMARERGVDIDKMAEATAKQVIDSADEITEKFNEKVSAVVEIPKFKNTEEALAFGQQATPEQIEALKIKREEILAKNKELMANEDMTDEELQESMDLAVEGQFYREAIESSQKTIEDVAMPTKEEILKTVLPEGTKIEGLDVDQTREQFGDIIDQNLRKEIQKEFTKEKPEIIRKQSSTVLKEKIQNIQRGFKKGRLAGFREVKFVQDQLNSVLDDSGLSLNDKAKFRKLVKNTQTIEQFNKLIPEIENRIDALSKTDEARGLRKKILKELSTTAPTKQAGKPKGKFTADIQPILDRMRSISKMKVVDAEEMLARNKELLGDKIPTYEQALENRLLSMMAGLDKKNPAELAKILDDIQTLKSSGVAASFLKDLARKEAVEDIVAKAIEETEKNLPKDQSRFDSNKKKLEKLLKTSYISLVGWNDKIEMLFDDKDIQKALSVENEVNAERKGIREAAERIRELAMEAFGFKNEKDLFRKFNEDSKPINLGRYIDGFGEEIKKFEFTKSELRKRWMELQDPSLMETFTTAKVIEDGKRKKKVGMGYTQEMIDAINIMLTQEDKNFALKQLEFYREYYKTVNEVYREIYGVDLPFNEFYSPIARKYMTGAVSDDFLKEIGFRRSVATGSLKSRVANIRPIKEMSDIDVLLKHINEMEHFKAWAAKMRDIDAIFSDMELKDLIDKRFGKRMINSISKHKQDLVTGGVDRGNNNAALEKLRRNFTTSALAGKPALTIKQLVSFVAYAEEIPSKDFALGVLDFLKDPVKNAKILGQTEFLKDRGKSLTRDIKAVTSSASFAALRKNPTFLNSLMLNVRLGDRWAMLLGGWSVYKYNRKIGKTHEEALQEFVRISRQTQQSGDIDQLSDWQRGGSFQKLFTMFTSSQNQYFRREVAALRNYARGNITTKDFLKRFALYHFILPMLFQWVVDFGQWNEKHQTKAALLGSLNGLFWINDILENMANIMLEEKIFPSQTPIQTIENGIINAIKDVNNDDMAEGIKDLMADTAGPLTGLPIKTGMNIAEGISDISEGSPEEGTLKLMGWSPYIIKENLK